MAPNRKQVTTLLPSPTDLANLQSTLQPKFLPLTHPKEEQQHVQRQTQQEEPIKANSAKPIASYWDWPADIPVHETKKDLFSVANLESNLIQAANSIPVTTESSTVAANDDYWAEESCTGTESKPTVATKPQHLIASSYWDWGTAITPKEKNHATIQKIVQEDKAHRIVSASLQVQPATTIVSSNTLQKSHDEYWCWESPVTASHVLDVKHPWANYWDEKEEPTTTTTTMMMIQQMKDYEHARQVLTVAHMVQCLVQHRPVPSIGSSVINSVSSDDYWSWSEPLGDAYWDTTTTAANPVVACGGCVDYWDM
jgi:hypothetical protein